MKRIQGNERKKSQLARDADNVVSFSSRRKSEEAHLHESTVAAGNQPAKGSAPDDDDAGPPAA